MDPNNKYTLILNDDVIIEGDNWLQYMIDVLESDKRLAYVGDFLPKRFCPPFGGWIDGWCMLFKSQVFNTVGLFDPEYIWWYAPADYAIRTYKAGFLIKDIKRPEDQHNHVVGVIKHLAGKTFEIVKNDPELPIDRMFVPEFKYSNLLRRHGFYWLYVQVEILNYILTIWRKIKRLSGKNL